MSHGLKLMFPPIYKIATWVGLALLAHHLSASEPLAPPPQDQGLPYTRSAHAPAIACLAKGVAVFPGSRYGLLLGRRVRMSEKDLLRAEAVLKGGQLLIPAPFAAALLLPSPQFQPVPTDLAVLAPRWVYAPSELGVPKESLINSELQDFGQTAKARGWVVTCHPRGFWYAGPKPLVIADAEKSLLDSIITLFDTPEKFADPEIATRAIPSLKRQGPWTDHAKVTPAQLANLNGPETVWKGVPVSEYDNSGVRSDIYGSKVPAPGVYPRLLFSEQDIPALAARVKSSVIGQKSLIEMQHLLKRTWLNPKSDDGKVFEQLSSGNLEGLQWEGSDKTNFVLSPGSGFKGYKAGIYNSHIAYIPDCLTSMAMLALLNSDDQLGRRVATAVANYYKLREPYIDQWLAISDSEFGSSLQLPDGTLFPLNAVGASTHWRNIHGLVAHMNLGLSLDFAGKWMTPSEKDLMRRIIAKATYGRRSYGQDAPVRFRDVNWMGWDLPHFIAVSAIEGLPGFDPEAFASGSESVKAFCDWGIDSSGVVYESNGKTPGSFQFIFLSMIINARRGENCFGHPHWRKLLEGQVQMTSPSGKVIVNSGTQYAPFSVQKISMNLVNQIKGTYPESRIADYLLSTEVERVIAEQDPMRDQWPTPGFTPENYTKMVAAMPFLRLPSISYPGFVRAVLYDGDTQPTSREDLKLPLDFNAPVHGVFSSYSDRSKDATWINLMVRSNHYLGAGHHHADAGMFHFSALGVDWITESPFTQLYAGNVHNHVLVDGRSQADNIPGSVNGYNACGQYLGANISANISIASADLTYAYSWRWNTQPPQEWSPALNSMQWEMDPSPEIQKIFAGTARYKLRPWWSNYTFGNYIPTLRAPYNPMRYVFRSVGLVRGQHAYGFVIDDLKKDDEQHLYQWSAMMNGGVVPAKILGLAPNQFALMPFGRARKSTDATPTDMMEPTVGSPILMIHVVGLTGSQEKMSLFQFERAKGPEGRNGEAQYFDRLLIQQSAKESRYRVLLLPFRFGEALPKIVENISEQSAIIQWGQQVDIFKFSVGEDFRTQVAVCSGNNN